MTGLLATALTAVSATPWSLSPIAIVITKASSMARRIRGHCSRESLEQLSRLLTQLEL